MYCLFISSAFANELALTIIRMLVGLLYFRFGFSKIIAGPAMWRQLGSAMQLFGITAFPLFWGLAAALTELIGGGCLLLGFATRIAAFFIAIVMIVAVRMHRHQKDPLSVSGFPLTMLAIMIGLIIAGGGHFSADRFIAHYQCKHVIEKT